MKQLVSHLSSHYKNGKSIKCPIKDCHSSFYKKCSLRSHITRKHGSYDVDIPKRFLSSDQERSTISDVAEINHEEKETTLNDVPSTDQQFEKEIGLFYLRLHAKNILIESTIQVICEEVANVNNITTQHFRNKFSDQMKSISCDQLQMSKSVE